MSDGKVIPLKGMGDSVRSGVGGGGMNSAKDGSDLKKRFKAMDLRSKLVELKKELAVGQPDHVIANKLGITSTTTYNNLKRELYRQETASLQRKTNEDVYLEYKWGQEKCIADLDKVIEDLKETTQYNALVGLIRARSDIVDKVIKTGQDMGILEKAPSKSMVLHGHAISTMSDSELRKLIATEMSGLGKVISKYGETNMLGQPLGHVGDTEVFAAPSFNGTSKPGKATAGAAKAAAARKSRQVVKRTKVVDSKG